MSEPKAQLVDPQENMNLPGMNATGVITASSFSGDGGVVTGLTGSPNLNVGVVTATSFVGDGTGHAANLTGTPNLNLGLTTATSFIGDAVGKAAGLTGTPNLNVGLITATSFAGNVTGDVTGNITGLAGSITPGNNLRVGVCTGIQFHGDGSNLTGAGSSAYIAQEITATGDETIIDLSDGNVIYYKGVATTVGFASTSPAEQITFIRDTSSTFDEAYNVSYSTGAVDFDGTGDFLTLASNSDFNFGTGDYTAEAWLYPDNVDAADAFVWLDFGATDNPSMKIMNGKWEMYIPSPVGTSKYGPEVTAGQWYHVAISRSSGTNRMFVNGVLANSWADAQNIPTQEACIGAYPAGTYEWDGKISNLRVVKGRALYTTNFIPPTAALTNVSGTVLLCCQDTSSTTAAAVSPNGMSANGDPTLVTVDTVGGTANTPYVDFDDDDGLNGTADSDLNLGTGVFTIECWVYLDNAPGTGSPSYARVFQLDGPSGNSDSANLQLTINPSNNTLYTWAYDGSAAVAIAGSTDLQGAWHHIAVVRTSNNTITQYVDGTAEGNQTSVTDNFNPNSGSPRVRIGQYDTGGTNGVFNGKISNLRVLVGTALYTSNFTAPNPPLTNITNTELLCCQSASSTTECTVGPVVIPVANGNPTAGAQTVAKSGTNTLDNTTITWPSTIKWNNNTLPTLVSNKRDSAFQIFHLTTGDTGASYQAWEEMKADTDTFGLWSWGYNAHGQAGQNSTATGSYSSPVQVGTDVTWSSLAKTDTGGSAAIKSDGTLWLWGRQEYGGSGQNEGGETDNYSSPTQIPGTTWSQISGGTENINSCWLTTKTDGTMYGWGDNEYGNLGLNNRTQYSSPVQIGTDTTWSHTAGSATEFLAIKTDGTLWGLGRGWNGTLGNNLGGSNAARSSPTQVGTDSTWSSLGGSGQSAAVAVKTDGTLWTWGSNLIGGLGDNSRTSRSSPTQIGTGTDWSSSVKSIAGGYYGNAVIKTDGTLWAWGNNDNGELGQNNETDYSSPVQIPGTTWNSVKMSQYNLIATQTDGTLWAIGGNWYGELGQNEGGGSAIRRSSPVQIGTDTNWAQGDYALGGGARAIFALKEQ